MSGKEVMCMSTLVKYRILLGGFIIGLLLSGLTAFPLTWELNILCGMMGVPPGVGPEGYTGLPEWLARVRQALAYNDAHFPFIAYGTDWLAFAHVMIASAYWGPWKNPARNRWVLEWGIFCCVATWPLILVCGPIRGIPAGWQLVDASFGAFAIGPLWLCRHWALQLEREAQAPVTSPSSAELIGVT